jgi:hypothetical protein
MKTRMLRQYRDVSNFAERYEDWRMQCELLSSFHQDELAMKLDVDLVKMGYECYKGCTTLEDFTAVYLSRLD